MADSIYVLGVDYGTNSVRALVVDAATGEEVGTCVHEYTRGTDGIIVDEHDANFARQHPLDYVEGMMESVRGAVMDAKKTPGFNASLIVGLGVDTTGSTPLPVDASGVPLAMKDEFSDNPNAMAWLWKDHTGYAEAELITEKAHEHSPDFSKYCGRTYSSEWFFSKILHLANVDEKVYKAAASFVECCDLVPGMLANRMRPHEMLRSRCAAGHKAMWNAEWGGLPSQEFLSAVSGKLDGLVDRLYKDTYTSDVRVGGVSSEWAGKLGLNEGIAVSVGIFDAHAGAVGAGIKPGALVKIMGTSTCDMIVARPEDVATQIPGICGQVDGSMVPGMLGLEAGQSAVGDIFAWYRDQVRWAIGNILPRMSIGSSVNAEALMEQSKSAVLPALTERAMKLRPGQSGLMALDWLNGNRTILVDPNLTGMILGLTLGTRPEEIFMALVEATAYGARRIIERFEEYGVEVGEVIACGGLAEKNPLLMQIYADITGRPMKVSRSAQTCALGAAMFGAVAAGAYSRVEDAQAAMSGLKNVEYTPKPDNRGVYDQLYKLYRRLHDAFGTRDFEGSMYSVMKDLLAVKRSV